MMSLQDTEAMLFDAIFYGNVYRVKQLITSGINKNTVLHSPVRWEGATVLGTASYSGNLEIVRFLVESGTSVNYQDPCLLRNPLHWACMGSSTEVVQYLLEQGAGANCTDRDNVTPILQAALNKRFKTVQLLIEHGADVHQVDRLRCSSLHYASFTGDSKSVSAVIRAGCAQNNAAIFGRGTPLANLVHHNDYMNCRLLLQAGYKLNNEHWLKNVDCKDQTDIISLILYHSHNPLSLKEQCRCAIRNQMKGAFLEKKINSLPIPVQLMSFLLLDI